MQPSLLNIFICELTDLLERTFLPPSFSKIYVLANCSLILIIL